ncbi:hypothetical protein [Vibrio sp. SCSIO 43136]|uniref:hypothetical protein n=1 Tax=Vibrio sp. SCSIO 43136 TaxID=2819101 RepID=UPI00207568EB|nr:hypothetical protein [Vibrio sp. SCSIO 43136]USD68100.1 hypothetical protein J4N39_18165 [Vibrio sp. SCSIO 43136]
MKELQDIVSNQIAAMIEDGTVEEMIKNKLQSTIQDVISDSMRSYGDFGKGIRSKVDESLNASLSKVSLPEYNKFIADTILESYAEGLNAHAKEQVKSILDEKLAPAPKVISAGELLATIGRHWEDDARNNGHEEIEVEWDSRENTICITATHPEYDWKKVKVTLYNHSQDNKRNYTIGYINEDNRTISGCITGATHGYGVSGYLYKLYCAGTVITELDDEYGESIYVGFD